MSIPENKSMENPISIIGTSEVIAGFKALGFKTYSASNISGFKEALEKIIKNKSSICLVEEDIYALAKNEINYYKGLPFPIFIPFSKKAGTGELNKILKEIRLKATGK